MIRCFQSENSNWTLDVGAMVYYRVPRSGNPNESHPGVPYAKRSNGPLMQYTVFTRAEAEQFLAEGKTLGHLAQRILIPNWAEDELYLHVQESIRYWIDTIVREVFP